MAGWHHGGGFSLDAAVRIEGTDRAGLERLLRYCARPSHWSASSSSPTSGASIASPSLEPDGRTELRLTPLELLDRLAALIPPPLLPPRYW